MWWLNDDFSDMRFGKGTRIFIASAFGFIALLLTISGSLNVVRHGRVAGWGLVFAAILVMICVACAGGRVGLACGRIAAACLFILFVTQPFTSNWRAVLSYLFELWVVLPFGYFALYGKFPVKQRTRCE